MINKSLDSFSKLSFGGLLCLLILAASNAIAQQPPAEPTFAAPDAWSFMKYGGQLPSLYTGTVSVNIPVYVYKDRDFEIPVSLGYTSNGFIPNAFPGPVGLGWFLNAGGYITREIVGLPDEENSDLSSDNLKGYHEYFMHSGKPALNSPIMNRGGWNNSKQRFLFYSDPANPSLVQPHWETEPDIFTFNFMGHTGKFVLSDNGIRVFNTSHPRGEYHVDMSLFVSDFKTNPQGHGVSKIRITTGDGYTYTFSSFATNGREPYLDQTRITGKEPKTLKEPRTWKLVRVEAPNGRAVVFGYSDPAYVESAKFTGQLMEYEYTENARGRWYKSNISYKTSSELTGSYFRVNKYAIATNRLEKITIDNECEINFSYEPRARRETWENPYAMRDTIIGTTYYPNIPRKESLKAEQQLCKITVNNLMSPGQTLKECDLTYGYPSSAGNGVLLLKGVTISGEGSYSMSYNNEQDKFPIQCCHSYDHWGYYNLYEQNTTKLGHSRMELAVPNVTVNENTYVETHNSLNKSPNVAGAKHGMLSRIGYPTGGYTTYEYEPHTYSKRVYRDYSSRNIPSLKACAESVAGGVRVKKIIDYDENGRVAYSREYIYKNAMSGNASSSGNLLHMPRYWLQVGKMAKKDNNSYYRYELTSSLSITDLMAFSTSGTHIEYSKVHEKFADGSYIAYEFSNYGTIPDRFDESSYQLSASQWVDLPWKMTEPLYAENFLRYPHSMVSQRGKLIAKEYYHAAGNMQKKETHVYDTGRDVGFQESVKSTVPLGTIYYVHKTLTDDYPLAMTTRTDYFDGGQQVIQSTEYDYNALGQLSLTRTTSSTGDIIVNRVQYISDAVSEPGRAGFIDKNFQGLVVRTQAKIKRSGVDTDFKLLSGAYYNYTLTPVGSGSVPALNYTRTTALAAPAACADFAFSDYLVTGETYAYDAQGNIKEITGKNGLKRSYLWGYGNMYPVAKIENASYAEVAAILGNNIADIANASVLNNMHVALLDSLRQSLPDAMITVYIYKPLVGITSIIDPSGRVSTYEYDEHGRLKQVKDDKGNPLNEYEYHFRE